MIELWHCPDARSFRPLWALEELGLPYELVLLPFPPRWLEPSFLELNPLGTIPFFTDGDVQMTESAAITLHLADLTGSDIASLHYGDGEFAVVVKRAVAGDGRGGRGPRGAQPALVAGAHRSAPGPGAAGPRHVPRAHRGRQPPRRRHHSTRHQVRQIGRAHV